MKCDRISSHTYVWMDGWYESRIRHSFSVRREQRSATIVITNTNRISQRICPNVNILFGFFCSTQNPNSDVNSIRKSMDNRVEQTARPVIVMFGMEATPTTHFYSQILFEYENHSISKRTATELSMRSRRIFFDCLWWGTNQKRRDEYKWIVSQVSPVSFFILTRTSLVTRLIS